MISRKADVEILLQDMRDAIDSGHYCPEDRDKNLNTLAALGITWDDAIDEIRDLKFCDYIKGPEVDHDYPKTDKLWVFKKNVLGNTIYIKFKIEYLIDKDLKVLSFHIDEWE
ncbi:MAG: type II toxin-antitoxin system MqsR family toxin [Ruminococcus sp.]|nr:type II toxin-antitoxin system MqsR family toxin [Ruminococcus sp.]